MNTYGPGKPHIAPSPFGWSVMFDRGYLNWAHGVPARFRPLADPSRQREYERAAVDWVMERRRR